MIVKLRLDRHTDLKALGGQYVHQYIVERVLDNEGTPMSMRFSQRQADCEPLLPGKAENGYCGIVLLSADTTGPEPGAFV